MYYLTAEEGLTQTEANDLLFTNFIKNGYLYRVTQTENLDSILEKGLVSLNKRFNENLYEECIKVNKCFNTLLKRNHRIQTDLIKIPQYRNLYKVRFEATYLSTNLESALNLYGSSMELFFDFLDRWCFQIGVIKSDRSLPKEELRQRIIEGMRCYQYYDQELELLLNFYDKHYEQTKPDNKLDEKAIIIVPNKNIKDRRTDSYSFGYNKLINDKVNFRYNYSRCVDIECLSTFAPEDLIAITINSLDKNKVKLKVHKK